MGCKAGLAETSSHVTGVLFYIEAWARLYGQQACTQMKCSWIIPSHVKKVPYAPISEINFKSARKLKQDSRSCYQLQPKHCNRHLYATQGNN